MSHFLSALYVYPVKSCAAVAVSSALAGARGLAGDRCWALVGPRARLLTQRDLPRLRVVEPLWDGQLRGLRAPGVPDLELPPEPAGPLLPATLWGQDIGGLRVSPDAAGWLLGVLGVAADLVALPANAGRWQAAGRPYRAPLAYSDGNPYHLITEASVAALQVGGGRLAEPLNFRPNFVVSGPAAFEEDRWRRLHIGGVSLEAVESCARCSIVNVSRQGQMTAEPLRSMVATRRRGRAIVFGQHLVLDGPEGQELRVGDPVTVLETGAEPNPCY